MNSKIKLNLGLSKLSKIEHNNNGTKSKIN
jgi:hypothetical protein